MFTPTEIAPLVERLRTDVLWHRRRGNDTIARDCQEAADEIERLRGIVPEVLERLNDELCADNERLRTALRLYVDAGFGNSTDHFKQGVAYDAAVEALGPNVKVS